jgi:hypothetical protein
VAPVGDAVHLVRSMVHAERWKICASRTKHGAATAWSQSNGD